MESMNYYKG